MFNLVLLSFLEIVLGIPSNSTKPDKIKIKLGFVSPLDNRLGATATLGRELDSVFRLAIEIINQRARKEGSKIVLDTDFSSKDFVWSRSILLVLLCVCYVPLRLFPHPRGKSLEKSRTLA